MVWLECFPAASEIVAKDLSRAAVGVLNGLLRSMGHV